MGIVTTYQRAFNTRRLDPYPVEKLKRVDRPTTLVRDDEVQRVDERESGFNRALRGNFGPYLSEERHRFVAKHPLSGALVQMQFTLSDIVDGVVAASKAPLPDDPELISRHIKETAYFLRADLVGICELPPYSVYSHSMETGEPVELNHKYAIAIVIDQDFKTAEATVGNDWISNSMSFFGLVYLGFYCMYLGRLYSQAWISCPSAPCKKLPGCGPSHLTPGRFGGDVSYRRYRAQSLLGSEV
jgi:hypothetical protein